MTAQAARGDGRRKGVQKRRVRFRRGAWVALPAYLIAFFVPGGSPAQAESYQVTSLSDYYINLSEGEIFTARTYMYDGSPDTHLWLYNPSGELVAANDDYFGLQSLLSYVASLPGTYRLRAGVCCGDPNRWYGGSYTLETNVSVSVNEPPTTTTTTTTVALYLNAPTELTAELQPDGSVRLSWVAPEQSNVEVESYAVFWSTDETSASEAASATGTTITLYGLPEGTRYVFSVRADNSTAGVFSALSGPAEIVIPAPTTTTTTSTTTTVTETTVAPPTETTSPETTTTVAPTTTPPAPTTTTTTTTTTTVAPTTTSSVAPTTTSTSLPSSSDDEALSTIVTADLSSFSAEQAKEIFKTLDVSSLDNTEKQALIEAIADAPPEIRKAFEEEIDIFGEGLDDYVPLGSSIDVGTRRVLIAVTAVTTTLTVTTGMTPPPAPTPTPTPTPTSPSDPSSSGEERQSRRRRK